jgi:hypothetical protein
VRIASALRHAFIVSTVLQAFFSLSARGETPLFLECEAHGALMSRDAYYQKAGITGLVFPLTINDTLRLDSLQAKIRLLPADPSKERGNPWFNLLAGLGASRSSPQSMNLFFEQALAAAVPNSGMTWVLGMEFGRFGLEEWEQTCLDSLEKILLTEGATASHVVTQELLNNGLSAEKTGQSSRAELYYSLSQKFDRNLVWPTVRGIAAAFPLRITAMVEKMDKLFIVLSQSWETQLSLALNIFLWLRSMLSFLVVGIFFVIGIKYAPLFLHWFVELFPGAVSRKLKIYFSIALFFSCISLGVLPFLWLLAAFTWKHCLRRDKWLLGMCCLLLILYPYSVRFEDMLRQCLLPEGSVSLFSSALHDGNYPDLDRVVRDKAAARPTDYLVHTAAALVALKENDLASAQRFIREAHSLRGDDPVVMLTEGVVFFLSGAFENARSVYESCYNLHPAYVQSLFNCGQCYLVSNETIKGMDYLDRAAKINPEAVNDFISLNDKLFSRKWPKLRQFMAPNYLSGYFWTSVFPRYGGSWATSNTLWGTSFIGISLSWYCVIAPLLFIILLLVDFFMWSNTHIKKIFQCKLCQTPMCRQCKKGVICEQCFQQLHQIRNENIRERIIEKIFLKKKRMQRIISSLCDIVFPGSGMLYRSTAAPVAALLVMIVAASGYGALYVLFSITLAYPWGLAKDMIMFASVLIPLLNVGFAVRSAAHLYKEFHS